MEAFEIVMFTCPQENIGAARKVILKLAGNTITTTISQRSCDYLIRTCGIFHAITTKTITSSFSTMIYDQLPQDIILLRYHFIIRSIIWYY